MSPAGASTHSIIASLGLLLVLANGAASARAPGQTIEQLEAAVVITFARFVEWSPSMFLSESAPIVVGIIADDGVAAALEIASRDKIVAGRAIAVRKLRWDTHDAGIHMLFVGSAEKRHVAIVLDRVRTRPVVTISPLPEFGRAGGMITLTVAAGRITFAVNARATASSAVRLSSFLLSHATSITDGPAGGAS